jgi:GGDEF domain-containing protein
VGWVGRLLGSERLQKYGEVRYDPETGARLQSVQKTVRGPDGRKIVVERWEPVAPGVLQDIGRLLQGDPTGELRANRTARKAEPKNRAADESLAGSPAEMMSAKPESPSYLKDLPKQTVAPLLERLYSDSLTGLRNNRYLNDKVGELAAKYDEAVMMDGDSFGSVDRALRQRFGDRVGGRMADEVLSRLVNRAREGAQSAGDVEVIRKGGEEILVLAKAGEGTRVAEAVRQAGARFHAENLELSDVIKEFSGSHGVKGDAAEVMELIRQQAVKDARAKAQDKGGKADESDVRGKVGTISLGVAKLNKGLSDVPGEVLTEAVPRSLQDQGRQEPRQRRGNSRRRSHRAGQSPLGASPA